MGHFLPRQFYQPQAALAGVSGGNDSLTKILLHMDGANGGTTFTDSNIGGSAHTWTPTTATTSTGTFKFGTASANFGSTGWIDTPDSSDFTLGSGDWTCDFWFNRQGGDGTRRIACGQSNSAVSTFSFAIELSAANVLVATVSNGSSTLVTGTTTFTATGQNHVALTRNGNILRMFVNGTQEGGNVAFTGSVVDSANKFAVGRFGEFTTLTWNGFIDEFRLSVGIARWTANFTPPTAAYF
jgi:hypothetical protein